MEIKQWINIQIGDKVYHVTINQLIFVVIADEQKKTSATERHKTGTLGIFWCGIRRQKTWKEPFKAENM